MGYNYITAEEAASLIQNGQQIAFSGFTPAGATKVIPAAIAKRAEEEHAAGREFKINAVSFISTIKVDCPNDKSSTAPTRVNILSTIPILAAAHGTKLPI